MSTYWNLQQYQLKNPSTWDEEGNQYIVTLKNSVEAIYLKFLQNQMQYSIPYLSQIMMESNQVGALKLANSIQILKDYLQQFTRFEGISVIIAFSKQEEQNAAILLIQVFQDAEKTINDWQLFRFQLQEYRQSYELEIDQIRQKYKIPQEGCDCCQLI